jgi:hypothetical protein
MRLIFDASYVVLTLSVVEHLRPGAGSKTLCPHLSAPFRSARLISFHGCRCSGLLYLDPWCHLAIVCSSLYLH